MKKTTLSILLLVFTVFAFGQAQKSQVEELLTLDGTISNLENHISETIDYQKRINDSKIKESFWDKLDYIGIDSYFPLVADKTPQIDELIVAWQPIVEKLEKFSNKNNKQILFTEFGYMSIDYTAWHNWENEKNRENLNVNLQAQVNAFEALFQSLWNKKWMAGGFIWKWHSSYSKVGGNENKEYTPQRKPVEATINKWYEKANDK